MSDEIKTRIVYVLTRTNKADDDDTDIYVGSTSLSLKERLRIHRKDAQIPRNWNNKLYVRMREVGLANWEILPLLGRTCDKNQAYEFEKKWIRVLGADLNTNSPITNRKEYSANYRKANKEAAQQYMVNYYKFNIENKVFYCDICEMSFGNSGNLKKHLDSLKHSYAWLNSPKYLF